MKVIGKCLATFYGERIVQRCPESSHIPMPFQPVHLAFLRSGQELLLQFRISQPERHVHQGAVGPVRYSRIIYVRIGIQRLLDQRCLLAVTRFYSG